MKKFHNCRFFPVSRFSPGQAVIPAQSLSLAKAGAGIHKKGIYFAVDSRRRGNSLSPASARAGSGEGQGRCRKIIQSAIMKKSQ